MHQATTDKGREATMRDEAFRLCIVFRSSPNWKELDQEAFDKQAREFCIRVNRPIEQIVETARLWDRTFRISFRDTRQAMKDIAESANTWTRDWPLVIGRPSAIEPSTLYLIGDDDDWYGPDLPDALLGGDNAAFDGIVWGNVKLGPPLSQPSAFEVRPLVVHCHSNGYAVSSSYFDRSEADWSHVFHHGRASREFQTLNVKCIPEYLSIKNTHPASAIFLEQELLPDFTSHRLLHIVKQYAERFDRCGVFDEPTVKWAGRQLHETRDFIENLLISSR